MSIRLWPDYRAQDLAWWRRHRLFPIMHVAVVRRSLSDADPGLAGAITAAFEETRRLAAADLANRDFPKLTLPWLHHATHEAHAALDGDPWTYGVEANRPVLEAMLRHAEADGLTHGRLAADDLFA